MLAFGATGLAQISFIVLLAALVPILLGLILGNLDDNIRKFLAPGTSILIPLFAFPLGAALNFNQLINAGMSGILLGISCVFITGFAGYFAFKLFRFKFPQVGAAVGATAGNAVATPAAVAAVDPTFAEIMPQATAQVAAAVIVTAVLCPILVSFLNKLENKKKAKQEIKTK